MQPAPDAPAPTTGLLEADDLQRLIDTLRTRGYTVLGPTLGDGAVVVDEVREAAELPVGWADAQDAGTYRLEQTDAPTYFGFAVGPHTWKRYLFPPRRRLWTATRGDAPDDPFTLHPEPDDAPRMAFLGVRACELAALAVHDRVFLEGPAVDPLYQARRAQTFIAAVNCAHAASTCFCASMNTGPGVRTGYDLALTECLDRGRHVFFVEAGTDAGRSVLDDLPVRPPTEADRAEARRVVERTAASMRRALDTDGVHDLLLGNPDHPRWDDVAARCLSCANCTLVCPTCFCHTVEDVTDLTGRTAERWATWDSCFTLDFSYLHGGSVRTAAKARYRQWLTHKLASWIDQFGTSGCVGCGRCIAWCPVGIDLTEEVGAIRGTAPAPGPDSR